MGGGGVGSGMVQAGNVVHRFAGLGKQGPYSAYVFFFYIEYTGTNRYAEPLMQAAAIVVAVEVCYLKLYMRKSMGAINHYLHTPGMSHVTYFAHRQYVAGYVYHVAHHQQFCFRGYGSGIGLYHFFIAFGVHGY